MAEDDKKFLGLSRDTWRGIKGMGESFAGRGAQWKAAQAREREAQAYEESQRQKAQLDRAKLVQSESGQIAGYTLRQIQRQLESGLPVDSKTLEMHLRGMAGMGANPAALNDLTKVMQNPETRQEALKAYVSDVGPMFKLGESEEKVTNLQTGSDGKLYGLQGGRMVSVPGADGVTFGGADQGMTPYQRESLNMRAAELEFNKAKAEEKSRELAPDLLKYQLDQDGGYQSGVAAATSADRLAEEYIKSAANSGVQAGLEEFLKATFGSEDGITAMRQQYTKLRNTMVLGDLPPGVASDKDIEIAMSGYPKPTANPDYVASFLKGMAKLNRFKAAQALYNKNYLSANRSIEKKDRYWKAPIKVKGGYTTNLSEIYYSALEEGVTVKQMLDMAGVTDPKILERIGY